MEQFCPFCGEVSEAPYKDSASELYDDEDDDDFDEGFNGDEY